MEELIFIYHLSDVNRHNYLNTMETTAEQQSKENKGDNKANNNKSSKKAKNRGVTKLLTNTELMC